MISIESKIISQQLLKKKLTSLRRQGKTIAFTNGCFDLMHLGHVKYLQAAKKNDRILIVGLNSDHSVSRIKDPSRPICPQKSRAAVLAALSCVDFVVIFNDETPYKLIKALAPDVLIKGADWKGKKVAGADLVKKVEFIKFYKGFSTTNIINRILGRLPKMDRSKELYRIIDANFNRAKEGLRVCEDIARYVWNEKTLTRSFKDTRHLLTDAISKLGIVKLLEGREVETDVGRPSSSSELKRKDISSVFLANMQRVKESLRVLEEISKLLSPKVSEELKSLRYKAYVLEQKASKKS